MPFNGKRKQNPTLNEDLRRAKRARHKRMYQVWLNSLPLFALLDQTKRIALRVAQRTREWFKERGWRLTGSILGTALGVNVYQPNIELFWAYCTNRCIPCCHKGKMYCWHCFHGDCDKRHERNCYRFACDACVEMGEYKCDHYCTEGVQEKKNGEFNPRIQWVKKETNEDMERGTKNEYKINYLAEVMVEPCKRVREKFKDELDKLDDKKELHVYLDGDDLIWRIEAVEPIENVYTGVVHLNGFYAKKKLVPHKTEPDKMVILEADVIGSEYSEYKHTDAVPKAEIKHLAEITNPYERKRIRLAGWKVLQVDSFKDIVANKQTILDGELSWLEGLNYLGDSPDGMIGTDEVAEYKYPRHRAADQIKPEYKVQCQAHCNIHGRNICRFISYHPTGARMWAVYRSLDFWTWAVERLQLFWFLWTGIYYKAEEVKIMPESWYEEMRDEYCPDEKLPLRPDIPFKELWNQHIRDTDPPDMLITRMCFMDNPEEMVVGAVPDDE